MKKGVCPITYMDCCSKIFGPDDRSTVSLWRLDGSLLARSVYSSNCPLDGAVDYVQGTFYNYGVPYSELN